MFPFAMIACSATPKHNTHTHARHISCLNVRTPELCTTSSRPPIDNTKLAEPLINIPQCGADTSGSADNLSHAQPPPTAFQRRQVFLESRVTVVATLAGQQVSNQPMGNTQIRPTVVGTSADRGNTTRRLLRNLAELLVNLPSSEEPLPPLLPVGRLSQQFTWVRGFLKTPPPPQLIRLQSRGRCK